MAIEPRGYLEEGCNPFTSTKPRRFALEPPYYVSLEDFQRVFSGTSRLWWKVLLALAYTSGGRRDELLNLTWSDVNFETQTVRFAPKQTSGHILGWEPKDHQIREVPIPSETLQLLVNLNSRPKNRARMCSSARHGYVIYSTDVRKATGNRAAR